MSSNLFCELLLYSYLNLRFTILQRQVINLLICKLKDTSEYCCCLLFTLKFKISASATGVFVTEVVRYAIIIMLNCVLIINNLQTEEYSTKNLPQQV